MENSNILETFLENTNVCQVLKQDGNNVDVFLKNKNFELADLEIYQDKPKQIREIKQFQDLRGFIDYINDFKSDNTACFAGRNEIRVIFDYHNKDNPAWGNHHAVFKIEKSNRWNIWENAHNQWMRQKEFANFLDSGLNEIISPAQSEILSMVKNFRATTSYEFDSEETKYGGQSLTFRKTTKTGTHNKTEIELPEYITLALEPFENLSVINDRLLPEKQIPAYKLTAKISWQSNFAQDGASGLQFKIQILNVENVVNTTLEAIKTAVVELTGTKVYIA